ncbi:unnamed protein product [Orchesella dallaii]|uniref:L-xylulose reductase n=1 Tax=Orchesella dallaii TaxID=48710 RepID=A0ABP1QDJ7_9HEXA
MEPGDVKNLVGKCVLVTGAGRGLGRAIVNEFHRQGAKIYAVPKTKEKLDSLIDELPTNIIPICVDLSSWKETETALENLERVDCLVNNAAIMESQDFLEITEEMFDLQMNVNTKAVLHVSQIVARKMIAEGKPGSIVNITSVLGKKIFPTLGAYGTSKAALDMLTKVMAVELGPHKITVNNITPGMLPTDLVKKFINKKAALANVPAKVIEEGLEAFMATKSVRKEAYIEMAEIVRTVLFLASGENVHLTGTDVSVDGGFLLM